MTTPTVPQFEVVFKGETIEPGADVAPTGDVTFVLLNESGEPHDFALIDLEAADGADAPVGIPVREGNPGVIATAPDVMAGDSKRFTRTLHEGRYALILNTRGRGVGTSLFLLTVQPADGV
jgi:hypothetical protein